MPGAGILAVLVLAGVFWTVYAICTSPPYLGRSDGEHGE